MDKKEVAEKLLDSLKMVSAIEKCIDSDYEVSNDADIIISVNTIDKIVSQYDFNSVSEILFSEIIKEFNVREPVEILYKAMGPIYEVLNNLIGNDDEENLIFDIDNLEKSITRNL